MPITPEITPEMEENLEKLFEFMYSKRADKAEAREPTASVVAVGQLKVYSSEEQDARQKERLKQA